MAKEFSYENVAKGFTNTLKSWIDTIGERNKLMVDQISNEQKMRSNFFYKILEQNMERQNKLKFIKEAQQQFGQGNQEDGFGMETGTPQMRVTAGGEPTLHYESPTEQKAKIELGHRQIWATRQAGKSLTPAMERFLEKYPEGVYGEKAEKETLGRATELRKEFNASKVLQDYNTVSRGFKALNSAYTLAISPDVQSRIASDQALGVLFQKLLDPQSVVRESEYARTPEGASFFNRIQAIGPQLVKGGLKLKDEDRLALLDTAKKLFISSGEMYNEHIDRYQKLAEQYKVDPQLIFGGLSKFEISPEENNQLPQEVTEEDIQFTMQKYNVSREEVLKRIGK